MSVLEAVCAEWKETVDHILHHVSDPIGWCGPGLYQMYLRQNFNVPQSAFNTRIVGWE